MPSVHCGRGPGIHHEAGGNRKSIGCLRRILGHEIYVSERIANRMLQRYIGSPAADRPSSSQI